MKLNRHYFTIILQKSINDIISESRRGYLGILWWFIEPILYMAVFYLIFVVLFQRRSEDAVAFLLIGLVVWKWFDSSLRQSSNCISSNYGLIQQVYLPKVIFPIIVLLTTTFKFIIVFLLLVVFLIVTGHYPNISWTALPLIIAIQFLFILAIGGILAAVIPLLPDLRIIIDNILKLLFFLSGIFFDISSVPATFQVYLNLNPMIGIINSYRTILLSGSWPDWIMLGYLIMFTCVVSIFAWFAINKFDKTYAKII